MEHTSCPKSELPLQPRKRLWMAITSRVICPACGARLIQDRRWQRNASVVACLAWLVPFTVWREEVRNFDWLQNAGAIFVVGLIGILVTFRAPLGMDEYRFPRREVLKFWALLVLAAFGSLAVLAMINSLAA